MNRRQFVEILSAGGFTGAAHAKDQGASTVAPKPIDEILLNPGMGLTTYGMAGGEKDVPNYPQCSIAYFRLWWADLEKEEGRYNFDFLDSFLARARSFDQELAFRVQTWAAPWKLPRVMDVALPLWFRAKATRFHRVRVRTTAGILSSEEYWAPDFDDPYFLAKQEELIQAFGERYNGNPHISHVDIGHMGNWGEWHTNEHQFNPYVPVLPMSSDESGRRIIDAYFRHWDKTVLVGNFQNPPEMWYATNKGAGWRCDGMDSKNGQERVQKLLEEPTIRDAWKRGPVTGEPVAREVVNWEQMFNTVLNWHISSYNAYSVAIPGAVMPHVKSFLTRCGYRLVLRSLTVPRRVARGRRLPLHMEFENTGVAPPYRNYLLATRLRGNGKSIILDTDAKLTTWLPGTHKVVAELKLPPEAQRGEYELSIGILSPHYRKPQIKLAIEGRDADGWYPLSRVSVA